jgi:tetratricopeptide (TPR) repeat protein
MIHALIRADAYAKLQSDDDRYRTTHKTIGDHYAATIKSRGRRRNNSSFSPIYDISVLPPVMEALYHYREAHNHQGEMKIVTFIRNNLKSLLRKIAKQGETKLAKKAYHAVFSVQVDDSEINHDYAHLLEEQGGNRRKIEEHYRKAAELAPTNPQRQMDYMVWLVKANKYVLADEVFLRAFKNSPTNITIYVPYAKALIEKKRFKRAEEILKLGVAHVGKWTVAPAYLVYSTLLQEQNKLDIAANILGKGLRIVPPHKALDDIVFMYSQILQQQQQFEQAAKILCEGLQRVPKANSAKLYVDYSRVLTIQGRREDAKDVLREGMECVLLNEICMRCILR